MSEAEMMQGVLSSIQVVISLFSTLFALISAYIAGLYFFLRRAPLLPDTWRNGDCGSCCRR